MISRFTDSLLDEAIGELAALFDTGQGWPELRRHLEQRWLAERAPGFEPVPADEREAAKESLLFRASEAAGHWESLQEKSVFRGRYQVQACIGRGSGGKVFRAIDSRTGGLVALKEVALRDAVPDDAWLLAAQTQARVQHPSVVNVFDIHRTARGAVVVMEFVGQEGRPSPTGAQVRLTQRQAVEAAYVLAHTLSVAHAQGIAHRDVTPNNVMVTNATPDGAVPPLTEVQLKVSDFGLNGLHAAAGDARSESTLEWQGDAAELLRCRLGTPGFMARERARFQPLDDSTLPEAEREALRAESCRGDVFELGATLRFWLTGKTVWPLSARFDEVATLQPEVSGLRNRRLARIVKGALGVERPYAGVDALKDDLSAWLKDEPSSHDGWLAEKGLALYRWRGVISTAVVVAGVVASTSLAHSLLQTEEGLQLLEQQYSRETLSTARRVSELEHERERALAEGNSKADELLRKFSAELALRDHRNLEELKAAELEKAAALNRARAEKDAALTTARAEKADALAAAKTEKEAALAAAKAERENALEAAKTEKEAALAVAKTERENALEAAKTEKEAALAAAKTDRENALAAAKTDKEAALAAAKTEKEAALAAAKIERERALAAAKTEKELALVAAKTERDNALAAAKLEKETALAAGKADKEAALAMAALRDGG